MAVDPIYDFIARNYGSGNNPRVEAKRFLGMLPPAEMAPNVVPVQPFIPRPGQDAPTSSSLTGMPTVTAPSVPPIDPKLYEYIETQLPQGIDYGRFPVPEMPRYQEMPAMPQRQFGQEAAGARQVSLRSGLIGLLLGGGAGAVAAATGAQQAYQQNAQAQYEQALREYQNRANLVEMANAQQAQRYRDQLAARQAAVGEAESAYRMEAGRLASQAESARLDQELKRRYAEAVRSGNEAQQKRILDVLNAIKGGTVDQATATGLLEWANTGDASKLPKTFGFTAKTPPASITAASRDLKDFLDNQHNFTARDWAVRRNTLFESFSNSADPAIQAFAFRLPTAQSKSPLTPVGQKMEYQRQTVNYKGRMVDVAEAAAEIKRDAQRSTSEHRSRMATIAEERNAIARLRAEKKPVSDNVQKSYFTSVENNFKSKVNQLKQLQKVLTQPATQYVPATKQATEQAISTLRSEIDEFAKDNSQYFDYTAGEVPTLVRKPSVGTTPPENPKPAPGNQGRGGQVFTLPGGNTVRIIR